MALHDDVTTIAAIATIWPPARDELLTAKADTAIPSCATTHENFRLVNNTRTFQTSLSFATPG